MHPNPSLAYHIQDPSLPPPLSLVVSLPPSHILFAQLFFHCLALDICILPLPSPIRHFRPPSIPWPLYITPNPFFPSFSSLPSSLFVAPSLLCSSHSLHSSEEQLHPQIQSGRRAQQRSVSLAVSGFSPHHLHGNLPKACRSELCGNR